MLLLAQRVKQRAESKNPPYVCYFARNLPAETGMLTENWENYLENLRAILVLREPRSRNPPAFQITFRYISCVGETFNCRL